ncbi:MAG: AEC family transporter [Deltaproteobacteria bacterium]|nr:AEC family transporter [Deltaproteobacteria bacterium]
MIVLNSLFPVFGLLILGGLLKRWNLTNDAFLKTSDKLIYFIFFPVMLFWKIGNAPIATGSQSNLYLAGIGAVGIVFILSTISIKLFRVTNYQAGSYSQSCFRFNTYVGVAIVMNSLGDEGIRYFSILIGIIIPMINALVIFILIWYSGKNYSIFQRLKFSGKALVSNPLIIGCITGVIYSKVVGTFPTFLDNTFSLVSMITLPLALLSIGGALSFSSLQRYFRISLIASIFKMLVLPLVGYALLRHLEVSGVAFTTGMIFFTLPTSTALYVLSGQLNSDTDLASASIVLSTILSFFSLSITLLLWQ